LGGSTTGHGLPLAQARRPRPPRTGGAAAPHPPEDLRNVDEQKRSIERNTRQFVEGKSANNVLLTGARGTGKSSLVKALLNRYAAKGLRLIEVDKHDLIDLPDIVDLDRRSAASASSSSATIFPSRRASPATRR
jgi:predicted AAA+ superfamily ATPase